MLDRFVNERLVAKPHFRLGRVHVDVNAICRNLQEQMDLGLRSLIEAEL